MPFTFKLSQRLARIRWVALLLTTAALAACEKPVGLTEVTSTLSRLVVSPKVLTLRPNQTADFMAVGLTNAGDTATVAVNWSVTSGSIAAMSTNGGRHYGRYTATADTGTVKVVATGNQAAVADTALVRVTPIPVSIVTVAPAPASVLVGQLLQLSATTADSAGNVLSGRAVTWASSNTVVATVSGTGLLTGVVSGTATITATSEGTSGTAAVTVTVAPVATVGVSPGAPSVVIGGTAQLAAALRDANGNPLSGRTVTWATSNGGVATVTATGLVAGVAVGSATITATSEGKSGTATVTVTAVAVPVASVAVSPATASLPVAGTVQLAATPQDSAGKTLAGRTVTWASSASGVATVLASGLVTGVAAGTATITATSEGKSGTASVTVTTPPPPPPPPPPTTGSCLLQSGSLITLSGLRTTAYQNTSAPSGTKFDATAAQWLLNTPDVWGFIGSSANLCWHGGQILGTVPPSTPYEDALNGYHLMYGVDVHGASPVVEGLTIFTGGDGITFDDPSDANWTVRGTHMTYIRDDCIENDYLNSGLVDDSFFDGCYDFISARAYGAGAPDGRANTVTVQNSLVRVQAMDKLYPGIPTPGYGGFWKWSGSGSPNTDIGPSLVLNNNVFRADQLPAEHNSAGLYMAPVPGKVTSCANNVMVWLGPGSFPEPLPSCFTVLTGQAGRDYWDRAVAQWKAAHPALIDLAPPIVSLWSPGLSGSSTLTGTVNLVATAADDQALVGVQFQLNGQPIGAEVSTDGPPAKYTLGWDSHAGANGTYTLTATARDAAGHTTTSAGVTVTISN